MTVFITMPKSRQERRALVLVIFTIAFFLTATFMAALVGMVFPERYLSFPRNTDKPLTSSELAFKIKMDIDRYVRKHLLPPASLDDQCNPEDIRVSLRRTINRKRRDLSYVELSQHSYMVSINQRLYSDVDVIAFNCAGVVISKNLVLTGRRCVHFKSDEGIADNFSNIQIRSESKYFSMNGVTHEVIKVFQSPLKYPYSELLLLQCKPFFSNEVIQVYLPFEDKNYHNGSLRHLVSFGFGDTWSAEPIISRYEEVNVEYWTSDRNVCKSTASCEIPSKFLPENDCCIRGTLDSYNWLKESLHLHGRFLVNEENYIMGVELDRSKKKGNLMFNGTAIFLTFRHQPFLKWIHEALYLREFKETVREHKEPITLFSKIPMSSFMALVGT